VRARHDHWLSARVAAAMLDSTSSEVCRLLSIGRLSGIKSKPPGRLGKEQWLIDPKSIRKETRRKAKYAATVQRRKHMDGRG
jgi:hypothetical protein